MRVILPLLHLDNIVFTPLPQLRLKAALVNAGVCAAEDVIILEYERGHSVQAMLDEIVALQPDVVGFSCYTWNFVQVERVSQALQQIRGQILVVWGGPHVSEKPAGFLAQYPGSVDAVITWYAERSFVELVQLWESSAPFDQFHVVIPGCWTRYGGRQATTEEYPKLAELGYPYKPEWLPKSVTEHMSERVFLIETFRNCPFSCSYCLWGQAAKNLDAIPAQQMIDEIYALVNQGARIFMFADAGLGIVRNPDRSSRDKQVFKQFAEDGILAAAGVQLRAYHFWQTMDDEMLDTFARLIAQGVMGQMDIGIQTFNPDVLHDLQRPTDYNKFNKVVEKLHAHHIKFSLDLVLGLPGDTLEGFKDSLRKVIACKPDRTQSFPLSVLPGTAYDLRRDELGIKTLRGSVNDDAETVIATRTFSYEDMRQALDIEAWMFAVFAEGLFAKAFTRHIELTGVDPIGQLEDMAKWAGPHLRAMVQIYRQKLYDSRSEGRYLFEKYLMDNFREIYVELFGYFRREAARNEVLDILREELLTFPKFKRTAMTLSGLDAIQWDGDRLTRNGKVYKHHRDPVIGAIVRNRNFYNWTVQNDENQHHLPHDGTKKSSHRHLENARAYD